MENLMYKKSNMYNDISKKKAKEIDDFARLYMSFLDKTKTEREGCLHATTLAEKCGYKPFEFGQKLKVGDKRYIVGHNKAIFLFKIGKNDLAKNGIKIIGAHIDSPRLDLKPNPVFEDGQICYFKTHYYGGIKKFHYLTIPLALHGVVVKANGEKVDFVVGEKEDDPVFYISDLLPHLSRALEQTQGKEIVSGEQLNLIVGGKALKDCKVDAIKSGILKYLNDNYQITETDLITSEICAVPAIKAREVGFDRAFISGYGQDDKSCAFSALQALFDCNSNDTVMVALFDKEEIGSEGNTGAQSKLLEDLIDEICENFNCSSRKVRMASQCLSADVTSAYDPNFKNAFDYKNVSMLSCGVSIKKYGGVGGKSGSNDASAELVGSLRQKMDRDGVVWQTGELGKVDIGSGGTIAKFIAKLNIDTIDIGIPVLSMHAPNELISKADLYSAYSAFKAFFN